MPFNEARGAGIANDFERDGYYLAPKVFSGTTLAQLESEFDRIVEQLEHSGEDINARWQGRNTDALDGGDSKIIHTHNVHRYSAHWLAALRDETFLDFAQAILGPDIILHHNKLFQKPPKEGAPFPVHQDWWYFPTQLDSMIAAVIFMGDADDDCGGFRLYPGSHKLGRLENSSGLYESEVLKSYPLDGATPIGANGGDVLFFSYFTLHGSMPNLSERVRKTVLVQMYSGQDYVLPNEEVNHANEHLVLRGWNYHMSREIAGQ